MLISRGRRRRPARGGPWERRLSGGPRRPHVTAGQALAGGVPVARMTAAARLRFRRKGVIRASPATYRTRSQAARARATGWRPSMAWKIGGGPGAIKAQAGERPLTWAFAVERV